MKQKQKEIESTLYVPPEVVAVEMQVEQGYEASSTESGIDNWEPVPGRW